MPEDPFGYATRAEVAANARHACEYCRIPEAYSPDSFEIEHVTPRCRGGGSEKQNLAWACGGCNASKGAQEQALDPLSGASVRLFHPRTQVWSDHFAWSDGDGAFVEGLTPTGRATVARLRMNRPGLRNLRQLLGSVGKHPPP